MNLLNYLIWSALVIAGVSVILLLLISNMAVRSGEMPLNPIGATEFTHSDERTSTPVALKGLPSSAVAQDTPTAVDSEVIELQTPLKVHLIGVVALEQQLRAEIKPPGQDHI